MRVMDGETLWVGSRDAAVQAAARDLVVVAPSDMVPRADFEAVDRERRALNLEADTYRQCIDAAGGLEALRCLVAEQRPVHPDAPAELAAWIAFCEAGCPPAAALPWFQKDRGDAAPTNRQEAPTGASCASRVGVAA